MKRGLLGLSFLLTLSALFAIAPHGTGMARDSVEYLAAGMHLAQGKGFITFDGTPFRLWPPLYPLLLAGLAYLPLDPFLTGGWLNALLLGGSVYLMGLLLIRIFPDHPWLGILGAGLFGISRSLFLLSIHLLSDLLFILLALAFFLAIPFMKNLRGVIFAALLAGLAWLDRYIGVVLLPVGAGWLALFSSHPWRRRIEHLMVFLFVAVLPMLFWMMRNLRLFGHPFGAPPPALRTLAENFSAGMAEMRLWVFPEGFPSLWGSLTIFLLLAGVGVVLLRWSRRHQNGVAGLYVSLFSLWGIIYFAFLLVSSTQANITRLDARLMAPLYPTFLMFILAGLEGLARVLKHWRRAGWLVPLAVGLLWSIPAMSQWVGIIQQTRTSGAPLFNYLNAPEFRQSGVTTYLQSEGIPEGLPLYSNYPTAVFLYTRHVCSPSPWRRHPHYAIEYPLEQYLSDFPAGESGVLIFYKAGVHSHYYSPEEIARLYDLEILYQSEDGGVYLIRRR